MSAPEIDVEAVLRVVGERLEAFHRPRRTGADWVARAEERAALRGSLSPNELFPAELQVSDEDRRTLLSKLVPRFAIETASQSRRWSLLPQYRVAALRRLIDENRLEQELERELPGAGDPWGTSLREVLAQGGDISLTDRSEDELTSLAAALQMIAELDVPKPDPEEIRQLVARRRFETEGALLLKNGVVGRKDSLRGLQKFLDEPAADASWDALILTGVGGAGKSTVLAQFKHEVLAKGTATVVVLDFDRPGIDPEDHHFLEAEIARQVAYQHQAVAHALWLARREARVVSRRRKQVDRTRDSDRSRGLAPAIHSALTQVGAATKPLLLVLDTFEVVTHRRLEPKVMDWLHDLGGQFGAVRLKVVFSGRLFDAGPTLGSASFRAPLELGELRPEHARELLLRLGTRPEIAGEIAASKLLPHRPLELKLLAMLAADGSLSTVAEIEEELRKGGEKARLLFAGLVYRRVLLRLGAEGDAVRMLASPGLVLRYLTVELIRNVLVPCLSASPMDEQEARETLDKLSDFGWITYPGPNGEVWHRKDLRRSMLKALVGGDRETARCIHERAVAHFSSQDSHEARSEALYHRLMLLGFDGRVDHFERDELTRAVSRLMPDIEDLPAEGAALLRFGTGSHLSISDVKLLPAPHREQAYHSAGANLVASREFGAAFELYREITALKREPRQLTGWESELLLATANWSILDSELAQRADVRSDFAALAEQLYFEALLARSDELPSELLSRVRLSSPAADVAVEYLERFAFALVFFGERLAVSDARLEKAVSSEPTPRTLLLDLIRGKPGALELLARRTPVPLDAALILEATGGKPFTEFDPVGVLLELLRDGDGERRTTRSLLSAVNSRFRGVPTWADLIPHVKPPIPAIGPDPEFRDPVRFALIDAFPGAAGARELCAIFDFGFPLLEDQERKRFVAEVMADPEHALESHVELADRRVVLPELLARAVEARPEAERLARVHRSHQRWRAAMRQLLLAGTPVAGPPAPIVI